jgi:hypothetical protein
MKRKPILIGSLVYVGLMVAALIYLLLIGNMYRATVAVGGIVCGLIPLLMEFFSRWKLNQGLIFSYLVFIFGAQFLGTILDWYGIHWWDTFMHLISGGILAFVALDLYERAVYKNAGKDSDPWFVFLFAFAIPGIGGVLWEIYEFITDNIFGTTLQGVGVTDTMTDLISDVTGGLIIAIYAALRIRTRIKR